MSLSLEERVKGFNIKQWPICNHQEYGLLKETYGDRLNELLAESTEILEMEMTLEKRIEFMC